MIEHHTGLHRGLVLIGVDAQDFVQVFRTVNDQRCANCLAALRCSCAAWQDRHPLLRGNLQRNARFLLGARDDHADRLDLIDGRIGGLAAARKRIEQHVSCDVRPQAPFQRAAGARRRVEA